MAISAERDGVSMAGATAEVEKHMNPSPRRIAQLPVRIRMPAAIPSDYRAKLEAFGHACPVGRSLHPDVAVTVTFEYV